jgi:hypothetical protein
MLSSFVPGSDIVATLPCTASILFVFSNDKKYAKCELGPEINKRLHLPAALTVIFSLTYSITYPTPPSI